MAENEIETLVRTTLQTKIISALKDAPEAIEAMIEAALSKPVDEHGGRPTGYGTKVPYLEYLTGEIIRNAAAVAIRKVVADMEPQIDAAVRKRLTADDVAKALVETALGVTKEDWRLNITFGKAGK
jgi:hypothetical protein